MVKCRICGEIFDRLNQGEYMNSNLENVCNSCIELEEEYSSNYEEEE